MNDAAVNENILHTSIFVGETFMFEATPEAPLDVDNFTYALTVMDSKGTLVRTGTITKDSANNKIIAMADTTALTAGTYEYRLDSVESNTLVRMVELTGRLTIVGSVLK